MKKYLTLTAIAAIYMVTTANADTQSVDYPEDYRTWTHIKSMVIQEGHALFSSFGGIHHIYANDTAMIGYETGHFPEGSIIAFDLLEAIDADSTITENERKVLGVMKKDSQKFAHTAGWGFEGFGNGEKNNRVVGNNYEEACFACHTSQKDNDYVFSKWRE